MVNLPGAIAGAIIDRRDGDSGIKGAVLGGLAPGIARKAVTFAGVAVFAVAANYALRRLGVGANRTN